jgi:hypothetical protein
MFRFEFMHHYGLPDETCLHYNATDYSKYIAQYNGTCPPEGYCIKYFFLEYIYISRSVVS